VIIPLNCIEQITFSNHSFLPIWVACSVPCGTYRTSRGKIELYISPNEAYPSDLSGSGTHHSVNVCLNTLDIMIQQISIDNADTE
jgi:hypothetical protein